MPTHLSGKRGTISSKFLVMFDMMSGGMEEGAFDCVVIKFLLVSLLKIWQANFTFASPMSCTRQVTDINLIMLH